MSNLIERLKLNIMNGTKLLMIAITFMGLGLSSCSKEEGDQSELIGLSDEEKQDLMFLREEEKLARDVYLHSFDEYGVNIFKNIANSEQSHMDEMLSVITYFGLVDPAHSERGVFNDPELQELYNQLVTQSDISLVEAYKVGATIEDLDINDLNNCESRTSVSTILDAYEFLECGSRNHLRQYYGKLQEQGVSYAPQYISVDYFNSIVNSDKESCGS
ncbi:MAG: DUF2202 domain-containing protein [Crocinitomicaceae bacterium]|nr:DUF2202 domain-containing protein [Crocinitomicaceae bacterium]